ncbi:hypothetical protein ACFSTC_44775 [Nonomuraea ferruginea]
MTLSTPLLAAAPLVAGLLGPALVGATPERHSSVVPPPPAAATRLPEAPAPADVAEHIAARGAADHLRVLSYWTPRPHGQRPAHRPARSGHRGRPAERPHRRHRPRRRPPGSPAATSAWSRPGMARGPRPATSRPARWPRPPAPAGRSGARWPGPPAASSSP